MLLKPSALSAAMCMLGCSHSRAASAMPFWPVQMLACESVELESAGQLQMAPRKAQAGQQ